MSEGGVGAVEREALDRARERVTSQRREYYRQLEDVAELERLGVARATGDRSTLRLVQELWRIDRAEAGRLVDEAEDLTPRTSLLGELLPPRMPATATVLAAGEIGPGHVAVIRRTLARLEKVEALDASAWVEAERGLAEAATTLSPAGSAKVAAQLLAHLDPDGVAPDPGEERFDELRIVSRRDGVLLLKAVIRGSVDAEMVREGFDTASAPAGPDDDRSLEQRRAAALKEFVLDAQRPGGLLTDTDTDTDTDAGAEAEPESRAEHALIPAPRLSEPTAAKEPVRAPRRAQLTITMDHRWLQLAIGHGTLDSGALTDPATVRRWACDAEIIPIVLGTKSQPLDVGRLSRTVTDALRRALNLRDGGCAFPGCTRRPQRCHAHHIHHWIDGGETSLDNLVLLCRHHHQLIHHAHWTIAIHDGRPWFTPPPWIDPDRRPRPGGRPHVPI